MFIGWSSDTDVEADEEFDFEDDGLNLDEEDDASGDDIDTVSKFRSFVCVCSVTP